MLKKLKLSPLVFAILMLTGVLDSCKPKGAYNQYRSAKVRPSEKQMRADKKLIARGNKNYKKQMRTSRKRLFGSKTDPGAPRK